MTQPSYRELVDGYALDPAFKPYRKPELLELAKRDPRSRLLVGLELVRRLEKNKLVGPQPYKTIEERQA